MCVRVLVCVCVWCTHEKEPVVNPFFLPGRHRYIPITCTLSPGWNKTNQNA